MKERDQTTKQLPAAKDLWELGEKAILTTAEAPSGDDVMPGFSCRVAELFA